MGGFTSPRKLSSRQNSNSSLFLAAVPQRLWRALSPVTVGDASEASTPEATLSRGPRAIAAARVADKMLGGDARPIEYASADELRVPLERGLRERVGQTVLLPRPDVHCLLCQY